VYVKRVSWKLVAFKSSLTSIEMMVIMGIIVMIFMLTMPRIVKSRKSTNDVSTYNRLNLLRAAFESYGVDNNGSYAPGDSDNLSHLQANYYIRVDPCAGTGKTGGFIYNCTVSQWDYGIVATPQKGLFGGIRNLP